MYWMCSLAVFPVCLSLTFLKKNNAKRQEEERGGEKEKEEKNNVTNLTIP